MKYIKEAFEDKEMERLKAAKKKSGKNWHDFIMYLAGG